MRLIHSCQKIVQRQVVFNDEFASSLNPSKTFLVFFIILTLFSGCSARVKRFTSKQAIDALNEKKGHIQSVRGRAWISVTLERNNNNNKGEDEGGSFPAVFAIDLSQKSPKMRFEVIDPLGSTHLLVILKQYGSKLKLYSFNFDEETYVEAQESWYGFPLEQLPSLLLGLGYFPQNGSVRSVSADTQSFSILNESTRASQKFEYTMRWIDPGPQMALDRFEGHSNQSASYIVSYSKFLDTPDFYLPKVVVLESQTQQSDRLKIKTEIKLTWKERRWNELSVSDADSVFSFPSELLKKFKRQQL